MIKFRSSLFAAIFFGMMALAVCHPVVKNNTKIIGGVELDHNINFFATLWQSDGSDFQYSCGASFYSSRIVLTAAHCVVDTQGEYEIRYGSHMRDEEPFRAKVKEVFLEENYGDGEYPHDLAVLVLEDRIEFDENVQPVVVSKSPPEDGEVVTLYGFGRIDSWEDDQEPSPGSLILKKAEVTTMSEEDCIRLFSEIGLPPVLPRDSYICFRSPDQMACQGDSGGPALKGDTEIQYGVTSFGNNGCRKHNDEYFVVYTSLSYDQHYKFIRKFDHYQ